MKRNIIILLFTSCFFTTTVIKAQVDKIVPESQVKQSIQTFVNLVDSQNVQKFGVKNIAELKALKPGKQFKNYMIGLSDIKKYKQGEDVRKIIKEYPSIEVSLVDQSGKILTSIEFVKYNNNWKASGYGSTTEFIMLRRAQTSIGNSDLNKGDLIRIPALRISFIAVSSAAGLDFISLEDNQNLKLKKGQRIAASEAILRLVSLANKHNGLPT